MSYKISNSIDLIIGHTGFVGSNLVRQHNFRKRLNTKNINNFKGGFFNRVVITAVHAKKWWANENSEEDLRLIEKLLKSLKTIQCHEVVLISTVDVLPPVFGLDEKYVSDPKTLHPYGRNRLFLENQVREMFPKVFVVRLPGLFGLGLKKNIIYDLLHNNQLERINPLSTYQFYDLNRLCGDIEKAIKAELDLVHLFTEPIETHRIIERFFSEKRVGEDPYPEIHYNFRTCLDEFFGGNDGYIESKEKVIERIGIFINYMRKKKS